MEMEFETIIECIANDGTQNEFRYSLEESEEQGKAKWIFRIMPFDLKARDWYEFAVAIIDDNTGKVVVMDNRNMEEYRGKGITEKMIAESNRVLGVTIISSSKNQKFKTLSTEWRSDPASIIWERLKAKGEAGHDEQTDIYTFTG